MPHLGPKNNANFLQFSRTKKKSVKVLHSFLMGVSKVGILP